MTTLQTLACLLILASTAGCSQSEPAPTVANTDSTANKEFFPVYDFLMTEIRAVDSLPVGLRYHVVTNGKADSGYISAKDFHQLAIQFAPESIKPQAFKAGFKETSFYDRATKASTFMYQPIDNKGGVRRVDVITKATDTYDKVSSLYIETYQAGKDSSVLSKMIWTTGRYLQMNQEVTRPGQPVILRQTKVVWNNWEETQ